MKPRPEWVAAFSRALLGIYFRGLEVSGAEKIPRDKPLLLVANHVNGLVDPMLVLGPLPVYPRFLGKNTLWKIVILRPFLALAGVIPVARQQDQTTGADDAARRQANDEAFARAWQVLADGGAIALFPEGKSHNEPSLQPLKTGAARIALEAARRHRGLDLRVVPIGLFFDRKQKFRSRALVEVGEPFDPAPEIEQFLAAEDLDGQIAVVRRLTARIDDALQRVTLNHPSWDEARLVARAAELWGRSSEGAAAEQRMAASVALRRQVLGGYRRLAEERPAELAAVVAAVREYDGLLETLRLTDAQVAASYSPRQVFGFLARKMFDLLLLQPLAGVGTVLNIVPFQLVRTISHRAGRKSPDLEATYKLLASLVLYPLVWGGLAITAGTHWGAAWGGLALLLGPLSGWVALRFHERRGHLLREVRAFVLLRNRERLQEELQGRRREILAALESLASGFLSPH